MSALIEGARYQFVGGTSRKFWEWRLYDDSIDWEKGGPDQYWRVQFRWGRLGTAGQSMDERFDSESLARWKVKVKVAEKVNKGYKLGDQYADSRKWPVFPKPPKPDRSVVTYRAVEKARPKPAPKPDPVVPLATVRRVRLRD